jgi:hypothetical protein
LGSSLFARHYSGSRGFFPFLWVLRCFSSPACRSCPMDSGTSTRALPRVGFPIRKSRDQRLVSTYSGLIAAAHVLHRLLAPRHPPCALVLLIMEEHFCAAMEFSRCTPARADRTRKNRPRGPVFQNSTACLRRGRRNFQASCDTGRPRPSTGTAPTGVSAPDSLERR